MGKLFDKRWVGDQLVAVVGLLVAAAMAALLCVVMLVAERVDQSAMSREQELLRATLVGIEMRIRSDVAGLTIESSSPTPSAEQTQWLHRHFGARLYRDGLYDVTFVLNADDEPIYSTVSGVPVWNLSKFDVDVKLLHLIQDARANYKAAIAIGNCLQPQARRSRRLRLCSARCSRASMTGLRLSARWRHRPCRPTTEKR